MQKLKYLSIKTLEGLYSAIIKNLDRYRGDGFEDLAGEYGWGSKLSIEVDLSYLDKLDPSSGSAAEIANSLLAWKALHALTPALASEDRMWTRLSHVEGFDYAKGRWFSSTGEDQKDARAIRLHFFAGTLTACRDDHALSRLWWNAYIAKKLRPHDQEGALKLLLKTADIRQALVERSRTMSRDVLGEGILRAMESDEWLTLEETNFREFMKRVNRQGGGRVFEAQSQTEIDAFLKVCAEDAKARVRAAAASVS